MANDYNAINLSQGFPNFPIDPVLSEILAKKATENTHQYAPMAGLPSLLTGIEKLISVQYGRSINAQAEALLTAGATQAIFTTIQALVHPGDEVIILDPSYDCYESPIILAGGKPIRIPLNQDFLPDWELIRSKVNSKTRLIITNNPHNPSGIIWKENDMTQLELLILENPYLLVLSDEVYEFITFELRHLSVHSNEVLRNRSIVVSSFGKTFHITGWKVGYMIAPEELMVEIKKVHQFLVFCVNSVAQSALSEYLESVDISKLGDFYKVKRDFFRENMASSRFKLFPCEGTYFQVASYEQISDESDVDFCKRLVKEFGVAAIPLSVFNADNSDRKLLRFCFAKEDETLLNATQKLCKI
jgi:methionine aminotransferase